MKLSFWPCTPGGLCWGAYGKGQEQRELVDSLELSLSLWLCVVFEGVEISMLYVLDVLKFP